MKPQLPSLTDTGVLAQGPDDVDGARRACIATMLGTVASAGGMGLSANEALARSGSSASSTAGLQVWGYYPWWLRNRWQSLDLSPFQRVLFFELGIEASGKIGGRYGWPEDWQSLATKVREREIGLDLTITLLQDRSKFERVFGDAHRTKLLLDELVVLAKSADGLQLDFELYEPLPSSAINRMRQFCVALSSELRAMSPRKTLSVFGIVGAASELFDAATYDVFDVVVAQGYDYHHAGSATTGPVAALKGNYPLTWEKTLKYFLGLGVDRRKLFFSLPYFGYQWPAESGAVGAKTKGFGATITYAPVDPRLLPGIRLNALSAVEKHGLLRDPQSGSPYYAFKDNSGVWRQGWFEDELSLGEKLSFARRESLGGVAIFPIGYDDGKFVPTLKRGGTG